MSEEHLQLPDGTRQQCYHLSLAGDLDMFMVFVVLRLVCPPLFLPIPDVSTKVLINILGL